MGTKLWIRWIGLGGRDAMRNVPLVRVGTLYPFLRVLREIGCPIDKLLDECRLLRQLDEKGPEDFVPFYSVLFYLEKTAQAESIENLGFVVGSRSDVTDLGTYGRMALQQTTIFKAMLYAQRYIGSYNTSLSHWIAEEGDHVRFHGRFNTHVKEGLSQADQFSQMINLDFLTRCLGSLWRPTEIRLQSGKPTGIDLEQQFGCRILFEQESSSISVPRSLLGERVRRSVVRGDRKNTPALESPPRTFVESVCRVIAAQQFEGYSDIRLSAEAAGLTIRTLQRRLGEEGVTYSNLVDRVRFDRAVSMLEDTDSKMIDIAFEVGYEDPGSFTRAFRRWSGFSPQEFRKLSPGNESDTAVPITKFAS